MPEQSKKNQEREKPAQRAKPSPFQKLRGVQQYQRQQEHHSTQVGQWQHDVEFAAGEAEQAEVLPQDLANQPSDSTPDLSGQLPEKQLVNPKEEQAGLHALDHYFTQELGLPPSSEGFSQTAEEGPAASASKSEASPAPKVSQSLLQRYEAQQVELQDDEISVQSRAVSSTTKMTPETLEYETKPPLADQPENLPTAEETIAEHEVSVESPYQQFIAELNYEEIQYLLEESSATVQVLLLKNASRQERSQILKQMPRKKRAALLRSLAESSQKLDSDGFFKAFHWLRRKVEQRQKPDLNRALSVKLNGSELADGLESSLGNDLDNTVEEYPEVSGMKVLSQILDSLLPEQEEQVLQNVVQNDHELADWLQRDRGSQRQREILRQLSRQVNGQELALLYGIPRYGRLLRHLLDGQKKLEVLNASIDLAQLRPEQRLQLQGELLASYPILQEC